MRPLGLQVLAWVPGSLDYVLQARPKYLKTLVANRSVLESISYEIPDMHVTYRHYADLGTQQRLLADPIAGAREFASVVLADIDPARECIGACESLNETGLWNDADRYSLWTAEYARIMRAEGMPTIAYNFSTGTPSGYFTGSGDLYPDEFREGLRAYWAHYWDGLRESTYLGLHEYSAPTMQAGQSWLCLRYRRVWDILPEDCRKPIMITETGIDGGVIGRTPEQSGWRSFCSEGEYLLQLAWYTGELAQDAYVVGSHIFHAGSMDPTWASFGLLGCNQIADYIRNQREEPTMPDFSFGFRELHDSAPDVVGDATSEQITIPNVFSFQLTTKGLLLYKAGSEPRAGDCKFFAQTLPLP